MTAKEEANTHWEYIEGVIDTLLGTEAEDDFVWDMSKQDMLNLIKYHYTTAFEHGWKHALEAQEKTK